MAQLTLSFFGSFQASLDGTPLSVRSARIQALLAYLALEADRAHTREVLAALFWPDETDQVAKQNLRQALYQLRQLLEGHNEPFLIVTRDTVQFNPCSAYTLDVMLFSEHLKRGRLKQAAEIYQAELLAQLLNNSDRFEEWLVLRREQLHILALDALHQLAEQSLQQHEYAQAQHYARRQLAFEPWREQSHRQLMLALAQQGERSAALAQYETCCRILADELGVDPEQETQALLEQIRNGELDKAIDRWTDRPVVTNDVLSSPTQLALLSARHDWADMLEVGAFYGRARELEQLNSWLIDDRCRLIAVLGMGGMGKTTLAARQAQQCAEQFAFVIWRSLINAPTLQELITGWLRVLSDQQLAQMPDGLDAQLVLLFEYLRRSRCLLVLDNLESIMQGGERAGHYRPGYEDYGQLLLRMAQSRHQSCLLITSREQPRELARLLAETTLVRALPLAGLEPINGNQLVIERGLSGLGANAAALVERYSGNPLALKLVAEAIQDVFAGDIDAFMADETLIFDDIRDVLDQQFARLAPLERDIMLWLTVAREPMTEAQLWQDFARDTARRSFLEALRSLLRRSLLEHYGSAFGLQNVVTEYLTDYLITQACQEFEAETPTLLHRHALLKAMTKEHVRHSQQRILLQPIGERLLGALGRNGLEALFKRLLAASSHGERALQPSFLAGTILNLLLLLGIDLRGYSFAGLSIWQAYLRGADLPAVDFTRADLTGSVFTDYVGAVMAIAISPDGQLLAAGADNGTIYLWQLHTRQLLGTYLGHQGHLGGLSFSPDGRWLLSGSDDHTLRMWEVSTWQALRIYSGHSGGIIGVAFHPDGATMASASIDHTARVWDAKTGQQLQIFQDHEAMVSAVAFSPDGSILATSSHDQTICLWDWRSNHMLHSLRGHSGPVRAIAFSPQPVLIKQAQRMLLVSGSYDQTLRLWDVQSGELIGSLTGHSAPIIALTFSADGELLISSSDDQTVRVWSLGDYGHDAEYGRTVRILHGHSAAVIALAVLPQADQPLLVSGSYDRTVRLWDLHSGQALAILQGHAKWLQALVFTPDGRLLVSGSDGQNIRVWEGQSGRAILTLRGHTSQTEKLSFRADGMQLASASWDKTTRIWDVRRGMALHVLHGHTAPVVAAATGPGPQGRSLIASGGLDQSVRLWDALTGHALAVSHGHHDRVVAFDFRPDGTMLASGCWDNQIGLWDTHNGELLRFLQGHSGPIECVAFHPGGEVLASGSWDRSVRVWDVRTGQLLHTLEAHSNGLEMIAFSPDGRLLASCACDHLVCVWDVQQGQLLYTLQGHTSWVRCVAFSPDSTLLASGSDDGTVKLWEVGPTDAGACRQTIAMENPYTGLNITGVTGITEAQKAALIALGAIEHSIF